MTEQNTPSNSDLVEEILERVAVAEKDGWYGYDEQARADVRELAQQLEQAEQRADEAEEFISRQGMQQAFNQWKPFLRSALTPDEGAAPGVR